MARTLATPTRPYTTPCDEPQQTCPECGGLECLCRPRFFAGQLLTDADLNLLSHYIVEKNKLHNRYLHGWGVVCGLEVVCHPCDMVSVLPGYALSPCGEDIIVCAEQTVDVCSLIAKCQKPKPSCDPIDAAGAAAGADRCTDVIDKWVLAIAYEEKPTRGVTSLRGASGASCCSKCACGGSGNCGCSKPSKKCTCNGSSGSNGHSPAGCTCGGRVSSKTPTPAQCEPTAICEGFRFEVCKLPPEPARGATTDPGPLVDRLTCCLQLFLKTVSLPPASPTPANLLAWCCAMRDSLADLFAAHPGHACLLAEKIGTTCTGITAATTAADVMKELMPYMIQFLRDCFCSALLPPCPAPVDDDRVFLATITVRRRDCKIIDICNWEQRKFAVGFPMLAYWLSPLPIAKNLKKLIARICCQVAPTPGIVKLNRDAALKMDAAKYPITEDLRSATFSRVMADSFVRAEHSVDAGTLAMASMGAVDEKDQTLLSDDEMSMPMETFLLHQIVRPMIADSGVLGALGGMTAGTAAETIDLASVRSQMFQMQETIDQHQRTIDELQAKLNKK